jgi:N-acetylmuramoyl-L-alanine amidase
MTKQKNIIAVIFSALLLCFFSSSSVAQSNKTLVKKIEFTKAQKLEISLSQKSTFKVFTLSTPDRLVIDIEGAKLENTKYKPALPDFAKNFRIKNDEKNLRIVFDLTKKISPKNTSFDPKTKKITTDLAAEKPGSPVDFISQKVEEFDVETKKVINPDGSAKYVVTKTPKAAKKPVVVIDAGHGGKDPGAIGIFARSKEKNITLSYAKELGKNLVNTGRYKVYLTRDSDNFIPLFQRVEIARKKKADLFISIHANSAEDNSVSGFSIYTLSEKASDKRAELLAQKENRADIIHGVDFAGASRDIMKTLIDLSQRQSKNSSSAFANITIKSIKTSEIEILQNSHRFAGFAVLTAPDMASVLIELGYVSNKYEEKLLNSIGYKRRVADSLTKAIDDYFKQNKI